MTLDWLDAFLIYGFFTIATVAGLGSLLHLQLGLARIANFGVVGFFGIGMYAFGIAYVKIDWPFADPWQFLVCLFIGTAVAGVSGLVIGWLIADLNEDGMLVGTLGFATVVFALATTERELTGGAQGMGGLGFPFDIGGVKANELLWLLITVVVVGVIIFYVWRVHRSPYGRLLVAVGSNEPLARSLGKSTFRTKLWLFALSSAGMGLLGAFYGVNERFLRPTNLGVDITLAAMVALVLGGTARVWGATVGVLLTVGLFDIVVQNYLPVPREWYGQALPVAREALFGAALILVLLFRPAGILGVMRRDKLMRRIHGA